MHRPSGDTTGIESTIKTHLIRYRLELRLDDYYMRLEFSSPQCAPTKSMEGTVE